MWFHGVDCIGWLTSTSALAQWPSCTTALVIACLPQDDEDEDGDEDEAEAQKVRHAACLTALCTALCTARCTAHATARRLPACALATRVERCRPAASILRSQPLGLLALCLCAGCAFW